MDALNVAAIIVTRGDQDLTPVIVSIPMDWELLVWDNGAGRVFKRVTEGGLMARMITGHSEGLPDLSVYGRYAAIEYTDADLIYVQDDDCIVSDPQAIVRRYMDALGREWDKTLLPGVVCNMPQEFRHDFYEEHALVGFGAAFHRDAPQRAWDRFRHATALNSEQDTAWVYRTCDIVFTALTPRVLVDVPHEDLPWAHYEDRLWKQPGHQADRVRMLDLVRQIA